MKENMGMTERGRRLAARIGAMPRGRFKETTYLARNSARRPRPSASAIPRMDWTRILPEAAGLRPTASAALVPMRPTAVAAAMRPAAEAMLPVISARIMCVVVGLFLFVLSVVHVYWIHAPDC